MVRFSERWLHTLGLLIGLALPLFASPASAEPVARSGLYDALTLAVVVDAISGVFTDARGMDGPGGAPQFSCIFLLRGQLTGDRAKVETWFPGDPTHIPGVLVFKGDTANLTLAEEHGGCPMTSGTMVGQPYEMSRDTAENAAGWVGVALVTAKRAVFRSAPEKTAPRAPYVVTFDPIVILERRENWVRATYRSGTKPITGWLPASDLAIVMR